MKIAIIDPQGQILEEISWPETTRKTVATSYAWCLRQPNEVNFGVVNRAILKRWSPSALEYIKRRAHRIFKS